jgi:uncharacterized protein (DUF58 family)
MQMTTPKSARLLSPEALVRIKDLSLVARGVVEGFVAGHHKSPYKGFSLEFAEHRKYVFGDELKHMDWRVYGRTGKHFVKLFEAETNMRVYLVLDTSQSMGFSDGIHPSKLTYATCLAASLAFLIHRQQDLSGLVTFDEKITDFIPARHSTQHLRHLMQKLSHVFSMGKTKTAEVLQKLAERLPRRGLIVLFSDLFDDADALLKAVARFRFHKHAVIVFHILDNAERIFPFKAMTAFEDLETQERMTVDPVALRPDYLEGIEAFCKRYKTSFLKMKADYVPVNTLVPFEHILSSYLKFREQHA